VGDADDGHRHDGVLDDVHDPVVALADPVPVVPVIFFSAERTMRGLLGSHQGLERPGRLGPAGLDGRRVGGALDEGLADLLALPVVRHPQTLLLPRIRELWKSISEYDAAYVALAEVLEAPLLTRDARLARSHGHRARIELV
jgi:hypothetical protein